MTTEAEDPKAAFPLEDKTPPPSLDALLSPQAASPAESLSMQNIVVTSKGAGVSASPLDDLLSPRATFPTHGLSREFVAESDFNDSTSGEEATRFSTVTLSARDSIGSASSNAAIISPRTSLDGDSRFSVGSLESSEFVAPSNKSLHRKTASASSSHSNASNLPFMVQKLELQAAQDPDHKLNRSSVDGQHQLQEEFARMQQEPGAAPSTSAIDWDFWGDVISDYQKFASENGEQLAHAIEKGIPDTLRGMMWQLMSVSKDPELESTYLQLLKEVSPHEKAIIRDLGRTFPHHEFFTDGQGIGQENLFNVLKAYSLYDSQVGYCQGLPFVVAILLLNMPDEEAFSLLVRLMYSYDLRGHFLPEMPKLQLRLFQFDRLVEEILPVLNVHFLRQGIKSSMFCSQWFLTMFSYRFPLEIVFRIYDKCLASGIESIFSFSIALLHKNEETLLKLKFDEILAFFKNRVLEFYKMTETHEKDEKTDEGAPRKGDRYRVDELVQDAVSLRITPFMLDNYAHEYEEQIRTRDAHAIEVDTLRNSNRNLSAQVKNLEASLAQLNGEHVEVLNQLVMARLRNEEMEGELVRYKLLYAEAMHQNADALSSHRLSTATIVRRSSNDPKT